MLFMSARRAHLVIIYVTSMNIYKVTASVAALAVLSVAGIASAQVVTTNGSGVNVVSTPVTTQITPGANGVTVGNFSITGNTNGAGIVSVPVTVTATNGATPGNLTNCQIFNANGTPLNTGSNVVSTLSATNAFVLDTPLTISGGVTTNLSIRCNVASATPGASTFQLVVGATTLNGALSVQLDTAPSVPAGSQNVSLANISLDATHSANSVVFSSFPITLSAGNGGSLGNLTGCQIFNTANGIAAGAVLGTGTLVNNGGPTTFTLSSPITVAAGTANMLALNCNVSSGSPVGSTFTLAIDPATIPATVSGTGTSITPTVGVGIGANGLPPATSGTIVVSAPGDLSTVVTTPGVPNTGVGATGFEALFILLLSAMIAFGGALYLRYEIR
ncbi:MAG: hypothetical protein JWM46_787 [Candidatus Kaiserbacteria bacterium]|nr:hypothetical protein [Candidatus Kaiserbacteria bacterium]